MLICFLKNSKNFSLLKYNIRKYSKVLPTLKSRQDEAYKNPKYIEFKSCLDKQVSNVSYDNVLKNSNKKSFITKLIRTGQIPRLPQPQYEIIGPGHEPICRCTFSFPNGKEISGYAKNKKEAENTAMQLCIETVNLATVIRLNRSVMGNAGNLPISIPRNEYISTVLPTLMKEYQEELLPKMKTEMDNQLASCNSKSINNSLIRCLMTNRISPEMKIFKDWNIEDKAEVTSIHDDLPIMQYKDQILETIEKHDITLIKAETGCGKSLKVPQLIYDSWCSNNRDGICNIVICQPRRVAAEVIARRICLERNEPIGETVGYAMRMNNKFLKGLGGMMFYTCGTLKEVVCRKSTFEGITHLIIDEVHERSMDIDILLAIIRDIMLKEKMHFKLIFMSASANVNHLRNIFNLNSEAIIDVKTPRKFNVERLFLEDSIRHLGLQNYHNVGSEYINAPDTIKYNFYYQVILAIDQQKGPGAILVFLPGWKDIEAMRKLLSASNRLYLIPMHSKLRPVEIEMAFNHPPKGMRKVILSTNIAQTSITITDIVYVVDGGQENRKRHLANMGIESFGTYSISQSCALQRAGRAGRMQDGEAYHLYSLKAYERLPEYPMVEIETNSLNDILFKSLTYGLAPYIWSMFSPLLTEKKISTSLENLRLCGLVETDDCNNFSLTSMGRTISTLGYSFMFTKPLIFSYLLGATESVINYVGMEMIKDRMSYMRELIGESKEKCDISTMSKIPYSYTGCHTGSVSILASDYDKEKLNLIYRLQTVTENITEWAPFLPPIGNDNVRVARREYSAFGQTVDNSKNMWNLQHQIALGCLLSTTNNLIRVQYHGGKLVPILRNCGKIIFSKKSVFNSVDLEEDMLIMSNSETLLEESNRILCDSASIIHPLIAALFYENNSTIDLTNNTLKFEDDRITFSSDTETIKGIHDIRLLLKEIIPFICQSNEHVKEGKHVNDEFLEEVCEFMNKICIVIKDAIK